MGSPTGSSCDRDRTGRARRPWSHGRADLMLNLGAPPAGQRQALRTRFPGRLRVHAGLALVFESLNTRAPPFDDVRVRRAFNFAVDRRRAVQILGGREVAASTCQILPPQMPGFRRYCPYAHSMRKARRLVAASGTAGMRVRVWGVGAPTRDGAQGRYLVSVLRCLGYRATETGEPQTSRGDWPGAIAVRDETCVTPLEGCGGVATKDVKGRSGNEASRSRPPGATPLRAQGDGHLRPLDRVPSSVL